jgi:uncharacterized protein
MKFGLISLAALMLFGCASYQTQVDQARRLLASGQPAAAVAHFEPLAKESGKDQLVYVLDYAVSLQEAGRFKESAAQFALAEQLVELNDYTSISKSIASLATSETALQYKGENFEKVLINAVNSINYLEMGDLDGALVESRRVNQKLYKLRSDVSPKYDQNPFALYLSALIWEADGKWDDAYIAYKEAYDVNQSYIPLRADLVRAAQRSGRQEELSKWLREFPEVAKPVRASHAGQGELIFIYQQGWGPRKAERLDNHRYPTLVPVRNISGVSAKISISPESPRAEIGSTNFVISGSAPPSMNGSKSVSSSELETSRLFSIEETAVRTMNDDYGRLIASRLAGVAAKAILADQVRQKDQLLGQLAWIAMNIADRADLRQWGTLPESFQIARVFLKPGKYLLQASALNTVGGVTGETSPVRSFTVQAGKKSFISWRSFR